jgi:hypothetical protein
MGDFTYGLFLSLVLFLVYVVYSEDAIFPFETEQGELVCKRNSGLDVMYYQLADGYRIVCNDRAIFEFSSKQLEEYKGDK